MLLKRRHLIGLSSILFLCITSCSVDEWRAQKTLTKKGIEDLSLSALNQKIISQDSEVATLMIRSGITKDFTKEENAEVLKNAIDTDQTRIIYALIQAETPLLNKSKTAAVRTAIENNQLGTANALLASGFPKDITMENDDSPISWAVKGKREAMSRLLLSHGFSPNADGSAEQPLEIAIRDSSPSWLIGELVHHGANTNFTTTQDSPVLHEAIINSPIEALIPIIKAETDLNVKDMEGRTALFKAVSTGEHAKVEQLILYGADYKVIDSQRRNYLQLTQIFSDAPEITKYLITKGLDQNHLNADKLNALDLALDYSRLESAKVLIKNKAVPTSSTFDRLYNANKQDSIGLMIKAGLVNVNTTLTTGDSILIDSIKRGSKEMVKELIQQGADVNLRAIDNEPPLSYATAVQDYDSMKLLIEAGADVNNPFQSPCPIRFEETIKTDGAIKWFINRDPGITPIMMACDQGVLENVILLRENGAENSGSAKYRFWPGNFAARRSLTNIVQYMVDAEPGNRDRTVLVDLSQQRATVYNKDKGVVMSFRISSGKSGNKTKTGEFVVTNKKKLHVSTLYDSEMPYFQRLSYGDFGFHTGYVPGYPASHGCIRCPGSYAYKLYNYLKVGDVVNIQQ